MAAMHVTITSTKFPMDLSENMQNWADMMVEPYWRCKFLEVYPRPANCLYSEKLLILIFHSHGTHHQPQIGTFIS